MQIEEGTRGPWPNVYGRFDDVWPTWVHQTRRKGWLIAFLVVGLFSVSGAYLLFNSIWDRNGLLIDAVGAEFSSERPVIATSVMVFAIIGFVWLGTAWCHRTFAEVCRIRIDELEATQQEDVQRLRRLIRANKLRIDGEDEIVAASGGFQRARRAARWIVSSAVYTLSLCGVAIILLSIWDVSWINGLMNGLLTSDSPLQSTIVVVVVLLGSVLFGTQWLQNIFALESESQIAASDRMWADERQQLGGLLLAHGINPDTGDGVGPDDVILWV